jgi:hypothetical protein
MKITRDQYANAHQSLKLIEAALMALSPLTLDVLSGDEVLKRQLNELCGDLEEAKYDHREIIEAGEAIKNGVDPVFINLCMTRIRELQGLLKWKGGEIERKRSAYENRLREAVVARVPVEQFRPMDQAPTLEDEARIARERALIGLEIDRIHAFLGTVPFLDFSLLAGTQLEAFIPGNAA